MNSQAFWLLARTLIASAPGESSGSHSHVSSSPVGWIIIAALAAVFIAWMIIRASPPLLPPVANANDGPAGVDPTTRAANFVVWFIVMRWIAVLCAATLVFI